MPIKAREVREMCHGKVDPNVVKVMEALAEEQNAIKEQMVMMAQTIDQMTNIIANVVTVGENMKNTVDSLKRMDMVHPGQGAVTK